MSSFKLPLSLSTLLHTNSPQYCSHPKMHFDCCVCGVRSFCCHGFKKIECEVCAVVKAAAALHTLSKSDQTIIYTPTPVTNAYNGEVEFEQAQDNASTC